LGHALNKPDLEAKGAVKQVQGETEQAIGETKKMMDEKEKERKKFEEEREKAFRDARRHDNLVYTVEERNHWDREYMANHGVTPLVVVDPAVRTGPSEPAVPLAYPGHHNPHHLETVVVVNNTLGPEYRVNPQTGIAIKTDTDVVHTFYDQPLGPHHSVETTVAHPVVGTTVVDGVYVENSHPATVISTGEHDVQVGNMHQRTGKIQVGL
jgi:hypothetical protein